MLSYKQQLSDQQRLEVVSYILEKLQGTTPANPKEPQGDEY
jgi:cytochrome c oxidase cbb3-type subunit 3